MILSQVLEALLFASPKPLTVAEMRGALKAAAEYSEEPQAAPLAGSREPEILLALGELAESYRTGARAFTLIETVAGWQITTQPAFAPWVRQLYPESRPARLSAPGLETLALVAYRQPIARADIEAVRGVDVGGVLQTLLDRGLVRIAGRATELPGRPLLYATTEFFLEHFGLKNLDELPNGAELRRIALPNAGDAEEAGGTGKPLEQPAGSPGMSATGGSEN
jgi:segregation and condensation protein B